MRTHRLRRSAALVMVAALFVAACTSGDTSDDSASDDSSAGTTASTEAGAPAATGPSPGVTDDAVKIGVTYVDVSSLVASGLNYDLGDYEAAYTALFDQINAEGGINGRQIEPVFAPIDPTAPGPAEEQCVRLTEDEDVFAVVGFFLTDAVLCPLETHETAVVGGEMTPERIERVAAPWITWDPDADHPAAIVAAMAEAGELDGNVGVFSNQRDQDTLDGTVLPALEEAGIDVVESAVATSPADDTAALEAEIQTIAQRFEASDIDTVVLVGLSGQDWPTALEDGSYRPALRFLDVVGGHAFASNEATTDTSILDGSIAGGPYGPNQAIFEEEGMQECIATLEDAGVEVPSPESVGEDPSNQPFQAAFFACPDVALMKAAFEAAGEDLNYGTLEAGFDGLEVAIPGDPEPRTFGPAPDLDGDPAAYLFQWDEDAGDFVPLDQ